MTMESLKISENTPVFVAICDRCSPEYPADCLVAFFRNEDDLEFFLRNNHEYVSDCEEKTVKNCGVSIKYTKNVLVPPSGSHEAIVYFGQLDENLITAWI